MTKIIFHCKGESFLGGMISAQWLELYWGCCKLSGLRKDSIENWALILSCEEFVVFIKINGTHPIQNFQVPVQ